MKFYKSLFYNSILVSLLFLLTECSNGIETEVFSEIAATDSGVTESTIEALLIGAYSDFQLGTGPGSQFIYINEFSADHLWNERGGLSRSTAFFKNWNWDSQNPSPLRRFWTIPYTAIRDVNFLLDVIDEAQISEERKAEVIAEAKFIRGFSYAYLYNWFGTVPLRTTSTDDFTLGRAEETELLNFIETELDEAASNLPIEATEVGRATKGAAYGVLMKHYLNTKQWAKVIEYADLIESLGVYSLYMAGENPSRDLFRVPLESEVANEIVYAIPASSSALTLGNPIQVHSYPESDYASFVNGDDVWQENQPIAGTKNRVYDFFFNSFHPNDDRKKQIIDTYINRSGDTIELEPNRNSPFKYWPDPNTNIFSSGHDYRIVRYADVLLSKAEALNELNGPTQEAIDLINQVRMRAKVPALIVSDYPNTQSLRDAILDERGWEFWFEGKRREDLIRHGKFVSSKRNHPVDPVPNAEDFRVLFPIPQPEIDANPNLEQNPGY